MRIAHVMAGAPVGGAEAFFERLCLAQARAGDTVLPVIRRDAGREARLASLSPVALGFGGPLDLLTGPRLRRALHGFRPRVVMAWMNRAARFAPRGPWALVGRLGGYYDLRHYRRCDHLVANTRDLVRWIAAQGWPEGRVHHLPNFAHDLSGAAPAPWPGPGRRVLALGRLHPNKGFDVLVRALALLPDARLVIAGEGPERASLERLARECGVAERLHLPGWAADPGPFLAACEVFVSSSRHEPLGNMVLEAWGAGRPVVAAAAQGPSELIADGATGLLAPVDAPEPLAAAIAHVLDDPGRAAALAAAGRAEFLRAHAEAPVLARWREVLHTIAPMTENA